MLRSRAGSPLASLSSGGRIPAGELGIGALRQPALDVLEHSLVIHLIEDLVVQARVQAEGAVGSGGQSEEPLAAGRIDDLVVAAVHQQEGHAQLWCSPDELLAASNRSGVEPGGDLVVDQRVAAIGRRDSGIVAEHLGVDLVREARLWRERWQHPGQGLLPGWYFHLGD